MALATINLKLDEEAARIFTAASEEKKEKLSLLLELWLKEFDELSLSDIMDQISDRAAERGLTPEILESLLHDEPA